MAERTPADDWRDTLARLRFERNKYKTLASQRRKEAVDLRRRRRFLEALKVDENYVIYRRMAGQAQDEIRRINAMGYR